MKHTNQISRILNNSIVSFNMKAIFSSFVVLLFAITAHTKATAQCNSYYQVKAEYEDRGWTVSADRYCNLTQGQSSAAFSHYFSENYNYVVAAFACDDDVRDVDIFLYTSAGSVYSQDNRTSSVAVISTSPLSSRYLQVVSRNYSSATPNYASQVRILIFSKYRQ